MLPPLVLLWAITIGILGALYIMQAEALRIVWHRSPIGVGLIGVHLIVVAQLACGIWIEPSFAIAMLAVPPAYCVFEADRNTVVSQLWIVVSMLLFVWRMAIFIIEVAGHGMTGVIVILFTGGVLTRLGIIIHSDWTRKNEIYWCVAHLVMTVGLRLAMHLLDNIKDQLRSAVGHALFLAFILAGNDRIRAP